MRPTVKQQQSDWVLDILSDAEHSEKQAVNGPFFHEKGITPETLLAYAKDCRAKAARPAESLREALGGVPPQYTPYEWACLQSQAGCSALLKSKRK